MGATSDNAILLFRKAFEPEPNTVEFAGEPAGDIQKWARGQMMPLVFAFDDDKIAAIFEEHKPALFLFREESDNGSAF